MNESLPPIRALVVLVVIAVAIRIALFLVYQPVAYPDTGTYQTLASQILDLDFRDYHGLRTPGYAFLVLAGGQNDLLVWLIQSGLGVFTSVLLFWICFSHTGSGAWSLSTGLAHTLATNQLFFEASMLTETLSTFLIVLSVASLLVVSHSRRIGYGVLAGCISAFAALTRPLYVYVGPLFVILMLLFERDAKRLAAVLAVAFLLPVLAWATFNKVTIDYFGLSTMAGYNLTNHSGRFIEKAADQYATIRDIYLKHREQKIADTGTHAMTIFSARREVLETTGLDEVALSKQLTRLSLELFAKYPGLYLKGVAESWASFWAAPNYMRSDSFTLRGAASVFKSIWAFERPVILMMNFLAVAVSAWVLLRAFLRRLKGTIGLPIPLTLSCVIMAASLLQAFAEYGENPRYGIPTQSLAITLVLLVAWDVRAALRARVAARKRGASAFIETAKRS